MASKNKQDGSFVENQIVINPYANTFQIEAFDAAIRGQGVLLKHYSAMPCPIGMVDKEDVRKSHHDDHGAQGIGACSNGFLYKYSGDVVGLFINNTTRDAVRDEGTTSGSTVNITLPRFYDNDPTKEVKVLPFDRLYFAETDITVENWQLVQSNVNGYDRLSYPAIYVSSLVDSAGIVYNLGDFEIINGQIHWVSQKRPGIEPDTGKGVVYSIRYTYAPFYYIRDMIHEIRHTQTDTIEGRVTIRMPQTVVATREYVFQNEQNDEQSVTPSSPRQIMQSESGNFGSR